MILSAHPAKYLIVAILAGISVSLAFENAFPADNHNEPQASVKPTARTIIERLDCGELVVAFFHEISERIQELRTLGSWGVKAPDLRKSCFGRENSGIDVGRRCLCYCADGAAIACKFLSKL